METFLPAIEAIIRQSTLPYEEALAGHRQLVRELDVALNGEEGAAEQASLCDIVAQVKTHPSPDASLIEELGVARLRQPTIYGEVYNHGLDKAIAIVRQHSECIQTPPASIASGEPDSDRALSLLRSVCVPLDHNLEIQPGCATHRCIQAFLAGEQPSEMRDTAAPDRYSAKPVLHQSLNLSDEMREKAAEEMGHAICKSDGSLAYTLEELRWCVRAANAALAALEPYVAAWRAGG